MKAIKWLKIELKYWAKKGLAGTFMVMGGFDPYEARNLGFHPSQIRRED